ncbi:MAG TPA: hydantoinase/oxoprolinase family protein [Solirubrobacteraceae bacterium]|jgi:N-methylhydantoinase A
MKRIGIDIGGTFTDLVAYDEASGTISRGKVLTQRAHPDRSFLAALEQAGVEENDVSLLLHATTIVTNLLIERRGGRVGLLTTRGFRDVLEMQLSVRPNPFAYVDWVKPQPLVPRELRFELDERIDAAGNVVTALDPEQVRAAARELAAIGVDSVAVCLLHSFVNSDHELEIAGILAAELPGVPVSLSHEVDPTIREYERVSSTVINSYAQPAIGDYVDALERELETSVRFMHSGGGIVPAQTARKFPLILAYSGPAAGVLAGTFLTREAQSDDLITFDMGGTSCDVALIRGGHPEMRDEIEIEWGIPARTLSLDVKSVGAGGGSIAWLDPGGALMVGPQSAGASPGPACYGAGGQQPTVTDANLVLGLIAEQLLGGGMKLDRAAAEATLGRLAVQAELPITELAGAIYRIVNTTMALAVRQITVEKGIDPRDFDLVSFGGAGGQHAIGVANELDVDRVVFPPQASTFSALGLLTADLAFSQARTMLRPFESVDLGEVGELLQRIGQSSASYVECAVDGAGEPSTSAILDLRYVGQSHYVPVRFTPGEDDHDTLVARFEAEHEVLYGTKLGDPIELVNVRSLVRRELPSFTLAPQPGGAGHEQIPARWVELEQAEVPVIWRDRMQPGHVVPGPVLIEESDSTYYVANGWDAEMRGDGSILASRR